MAKVTVNFVTDDEKGKILIELDPDRNTDYTGKLKSKFRYGDTAFFRVYSVEPDKLNVLTTDGEITDHGIYTDSVTDELLSFITEAQAETEKPVKSIMGHTWLGNSLGDLSLSAPFTVTAENKADNSIAAAHLDYQTAYRLYGLNLSIKEQKEYPVVVYVRSENV